MRVSGVFTVSLVAVSAIERIEVPCPEDEFSNRGKCEEKWYQNVYTPIDVPYRPGAQHFNGEHEYDFYDLPLRFENEWPFASEWYEQETDVPNELDAEGDLLGTYNGEWKDGFMHGKGEYIYANEDVYEGDWYFDFSHGQGTFTSPVGNKYEGDWKEGVMHGKGRFDTFDGSWYVGDFYNGLRQGQGKAVWRDGREYEGDWYDNKKWGKGVFKSAGGEIYDGFFIDNTFEKEITEPNAMTHPPALWKRWTLDPYAESDKEPWEKGEDPTWSEEEILHGRRRHAVADDAAPTPSPEPEEEAPKEEL